MRISNILRLGLLSSILIVASFAAQAQGSAEAEIHGLIQAVEDSGCEFERNGKRYESLEAADHMRLKYRRAKRYAKTPELFIDRLASKSSITGRAYRIICSASGEHLAKVWLEVELVTQRKNLDQPAPH